MTAGNPDIHGMDIAAGHQLGFFHRALDGLHGRFDIDDNAFFHPPRGMRTDTRNFDTAVIGWLPNNRHHLGRSDIQPDYHV